MHNKMFELHAAKMDRFLFLSFILGILDFGSELIAPVRRYKPWLRYKIQGKKQWVSQIKYKMCFSTCRCLYYFCPVQKHGASFFNRHKSLPCQTSMTIQCAGQLFVIGQILLQTWISNDINIKQAIFVWKKMIS